MLGVLGISCQVASILESSPKIQMKLSTNGTVGSCTDEDTTALQELKDK